MSPAALITAALLLLALIGLSLARRRAVSGQRVVLFRALLPSWRFFESPDVSYVLLARDCGQGSDSGFAPVIPRPQRNLSNVLFAPESNLMLASHGLVEALVQELGELGPTAIAEAEQLIAYRRVQHMTCYFRPQMQRYQLKLVAEQPDGSLGEELFVSPIYERE